MSAFPSLPNDAVHVPFAFWVCSRRWTALRPLGAVVPGMGPWGLGILHHRRGGACVHVQDQGPVASQDVDHRTLDSQCNGRPYLPVLQPHVRLDDSPPSPAPPA
eukprot:CAMPEP_0174364158 /NCGR_PEP_ID=MMETSP0811_2-20130205/71789_1 /TAXON_ID=73025 ORGANISM="Eutreptiella gymnastica-like, Strain CCMP1594" /NCGR_SAMPLE_ID=MMETSP0811_2 /ASSEMBLY_ACC=CAM_ASM_000667 /LENGTH=103 /DNA_ID=CAMNT_0015503535 /DNA_START=272 /DNA_END=579 /DNA_ORIENTATION=-